MTDTTDTLTTPDMSEQTPGLVGRARALLHHKEMQRFLKFAVVGGIGAVIDYGTFTLLNRLGWLDPVVLRLPFGLRVTGVGIAGTIAFTMAVFSNFLWNRYWTYPDSRSKPILTQFVMFFALNVVGIIIRIPILELLSRPFAQLAAGIIPNIGAETAAWLGESTAWALAVVIVMFWNFFSNRFTTYSDVE